MVVPSEFWRVPSVPEEEPEGDGQGSFGEFVASLPRCALIKAGTAPA